jgi:hypothetical protein
MDTGVVVLGGVFALAVLVMVWNASRRRALRQQLEREGFVPCEEETDRIRQAFAAVAGGHGATPRRYEVAHCYKKPGGRGMAYRFAVADVTNADAERAPLGGRFEAYLIDLHDADRVARRPISLFFAPQGPGVLRTLLQKLVTADPHGVALEVPRSPSTASVLAAFGAQAGTLDDALPAATRDRLLRAAEHGFFGAHFGGGKAALLALPDRQDVQRQWHYVVEWM